MDLKDIEKRIDANDREIVELMKKRLKLTEEAAQFKKENDLSIRIEGREVEIIDNIMATTDAPYDKYMCAIFYSILDSCAAYQSSLVNVSSPVVRRIEKALEEMTDEFPKEATVACQGIPGASTEAAVKAMISVPHIQYFNSFEKVVDTVLGGEARYGVFPLENSKYGSIGAVYDYMHDHNFYMVRSTKRMINGNYTKFVCIGRDLEIHKEDDKISLMMHMENKPRALYHIVGRLSSLGINIDKIASRPLKGSVFDYLIYMDFDASVLLPEVRATLAQMDNELEQFRFLGSHHEV